ncbi:hypothetical protein [Extibacter muris]|uniref:hypothetical protein n=1 Tax=Extibacter muris TaxID=1796622 RepID=UPI001FAA932D|nr:hypothetical protein [Extibacter muris]MCU0080670.1 hypothetical protein [Extibacter muris]
MVFGYREPEQSDEAYSGTELLQLVLAGKSADGEMTVFSGVAFDAEKEYAYLLYFPVNVSKVTMYVNGERRKHYAEVMLKNISYMEKLVDDLKLTYQLENGMIPIHGRIRSLPVS